MAGRAGEAVWVEKYRPTTLKEMVGQDAIVPLLRAYAEKRSMPHLLFAGPPGTGKTTAALALARDLYGGEWRQNFLELNASVTGDTPLLVRIHGETRRTTLRAVADLYLDPAGPNRAPTPGLEVLSLDEHLRVAFRPARDVSRHRVPRILRVAFEGGVVRMSLDHSVMSLGGDGRIVARSAATLRPGDVLLSFRAALSGRPVELDLAPYASAPPLRTKNRPGPLRNPPVRMVLGRVPLDAELAWVFGDYSTGGGTSPPRTSGKVVFTHGYPKEMAEMERLRSTFARPGFFTHHPRTGSGFLSKRGTEEPSSVQRTPASVQWMRFFRTHFYSDGGTSRRSARARVVPPFVFDSPIESRWSFLRGYAGDAHGTGGEGLRSSSRSREMRVDVAWLARISGLESSVSLGSGEARISWPGEGSSERSGLMPADPVLRFLEGLSSGELAGNGRYDLRRELSHERCRQVVKPAARAALDQVVAARLSGAQRETLERLRAFATSDLHGVGIASVTEEDTAEDLYDLGVPGSEAFWGGTIPVLLHNSDSRGIDTVRTTIKEYARTAPFGEIGFKILFLDEADNLTSEAQASLRRMMERYSGSCRFILSCNYSSRIIEPIQSRCAVFRFRAYSTEAVRSQLERVAKGEGKKVSADAMETILGASGGDMRRAVNLLQLTATHSDTVTAETVKEYATIPLRKEVEAMLGAALRGSFAEARDRLYRLFTERGASGEDILKSIHSYLPDIPDSVLPPREKVRLVEYLGEVDFRLAEGASDRIQLEAVLAHVASGAVGRE